MSRFRCELALVLLALVGGATVALGNPFARANETALDIYVNAPDPTYNWTDLGIEHKGLGYKMYILNMTSQSWLTANDSSAPVWYHYMAVVIPDDLKVKDKAMMYITGGHNGGSPPDGKGEDEELCAWLAVRVGAICTALFQIPNEPITFTGETYHRSEDAIIAYTWHHFLNDPSQPNWLLRLPMTKAAVRALDTITAFGRTKGYEIGKFIVAGASKRGWTTWTVGAVDTRIVGIAPLVMDALNFQKNVHHFWEALGGWTFAFKDYYEMNFTARVDDPNMPAMTAIIDPYVYRDRLTMPKLVVDSGGDEFFMPDDNYFWWDDMPGPKHLLMIQNAEHSLVTGIPEVVESVAAFAISIFNDVPAPTMTWQMGYTFSGGNITLQLSEPAAEVIGRYADTLDGVRRDWRLVTGQNPCPLPEIKGLCPHPVLWHKVDVVQTDTLSYELVMEEPKDGWRAFFIEVKFPGVEKPEYLFTTQVNIIPNKYPFPPCHGEGCKGTLL